MSYTLKRPRLLLFPAAEYEHLPVKPMAIISMLWGRGRHLLDKKGPGPLQGQAAIEGVSIKYVFTMICFPQYPFSYKAACRIFVLHEVGL